MSPVGIMQGSFWEIAVCRLLTSMRCKLFEMSEFACSRNGQMAAP